MGGVVGDGGGDEIGASGGKLGVGGLSNCASSVGRDPEKMRINLSSVPTSSASVMPPWNLSSGVWLAMELRGKSVRNIWFAMQDSWGVYDRPEHSREMW